MERTVGPDIRRDIGLCSRAMGRTPATAGRPPIAESPRYCGLLVHLVYDAISRAESGNVRTIYDLWADALEAAGGSRPVNAELFLNTNPRAMSVLSGLIYGPDPDFAGIVEALQASGVDAVLEDTLDSEAAARLLRAFFTAACEGRVAITWRDTHLDIEMLEPCESLPANFSVLKVEGFDVFGRSRDIYEAVTTKCSRVGSIGLTGATAAQSELTIECPESLPELPLNIRVRNLEFVVN